MTDLSPLDCFLAAPDDEAALAILAERPHELLTDEILAEIERRIQETPEHRKSWQARRDLLIAVKGVQEQFNQLQRQLEQLSPQERDLLAFEGIPNSLGMAAFVVEKGDEDLDQLEALVEEKLATAQDVEAEALRARLKDLRAQRALGREALQTRLDEAQAAAQQLADNLIAWIQTPDWGASERHLTGHSDALLKEAAVEVLHLLQLTNPANDQIPLHIRLLQQCREVGISEAYAQLRRELWLQRVVDTPLGKAIAAFIQAEDEKAAQLLEEQHSLLLTMDARQLLEQFLEVARQGGDAAAVQRLEARLTLWNQRWQEQVGKPRRSAPPETWQETPQERWEERVQEQAVLPERGEQVTVVTAINSAIGAGATVFNIFNVGEIPLAWRRPVQTRPELVRDAVGREAELAELHQRLRHSRNAALVGKGAAPARSGAAAVRGTAGIGKTVLAAMYATRYADEYPGGAIWLTLGPGKRERSQVTGDLQALAAHAYVDPVQAQKVLENCVLTPQVVQELLAGHGELLIVLDDVWSAEVVEELRAATPPEATLLLTTRDYDVAYALARSPDAIQSLDVLSEADARALLQKRAPGLPDTLADRVAKGLGYHAQALNLAGAALDRRGAHRFQTTAEEILERVRTGRGFGDLPRMDKADRVSEVEIALRYSYDYLGEGADGATHQKWFRALGAFAQEADFDEAAMAALAEAELAQAEEFLLALDGLALVQEIGPDPLPAAPGFPQGHRWQQHAILRAYALSLQDPEERLIFPEHHATHYLGLTQACYHARPRRYDRIEVEFNQIEHAFDWCRRFSPTRSVQLVQLLNDFMRNRGRAMLLDGWLRTALKAAETTGDRLGKANTLKSLGDLESRLGNIEAARAHYDAALPLYEAEQDRLGKANTLQSLGDLERRLGNIEAARAHYDAALNFYRKEQEPGGIINTLVSQARLEAAQQNLDKAIALYEAAFAVADGSGFAQHPVVQGMRQEYEQLRRLAASPPGSESSAQPIPDDPLALGLAAFLQADSPEALSQALEQHPILQESNALFALAGSLNQALVAADSQATSFLIARFVLLLGIYNHAHSQEVNPQAHEAV
ncbi:MAG TPA: tetratricopeptide repeat protein, partial [Chromatiales bacterium]|nr:tetratricopeptide repeat protein [Chromatiales bacterium]